MPPKKRARQASTTSPNPGASPAATKPSPSPLPTSPLTTSPNAWTTEQEIELLKRIITHKPTGHNKRMNMLSIYASLEAHGIVYADPTHRSPASHLAHLRIPALWDKLGSMYDLDALDDREAAAAEDSEDAALAEQAESQPPPPKRGRRADDEREAVLWRDFSLDSLADSDDAADFSERMFRRRLRGDEDSEPPSSPSHVPETEARARARPGQRASQRMRAARRGSAVTDSTGEQDVSMRDELGMDEEEGMEGEESHGGEGEEEGEEEEVSTPASTTRRATKAKRGGRRRK